MRQEIKLRIELSGKGLDFKISKAFIKTNSWLNSWFYGDATVIVIGEVTLDGRFENNDLLMQHEKSITVETGYNNELPVKFYVINSSNHSIRQPTFGIKFIEVNSQEIEEVKGLSSIIPVIAPEQIIKEEPVRITKSYIPPPMTEEQLNRNFTKSTAQYRVNQINRLIEIARGTGGPTHMHSTIHLCDKSCPGHSSNFNKEQNNARKTLEKEGIDWKNSIIEDPYKNQKIEELYREYQNQEQRNDTCDGSKPVERIDFSLLVINSIFRPEPQNKETEDNNHSCIIDMV